MEASVNRGFFTDRQPAFRIHDISLRLGEEETVYPGDPELVLTKLKALDKGDPFDLSSIFLSAHAGTHLDAPSHLIPGGPRVDQLPLETFLTPAMVLEVDHPRAVPASALEGLDTRPGQALLFKTLNSASGLAASGQYRSDYVFLSPEAAAACLGLKAGLVGIDSISVDPPEEGDLPAHRVLLENGVPILEGLNLAGVEPGGYTLICLPLKLKDAEASPVRAVLVKDLPFGPKAAQFDADC